MARLFTTGYEVFVSTSLGMDIVGTGSGAITRDTTVPRTGIGCMKCDSAANAIARTFAIQTLAADTTYYIRGYFRFGHLPASSATILLFSGGLGIRVTAAGKLQLWTSSQQGSDSVATITTGSYYRIELKLVSAGSNVTAAELRLDGTTVATVSGLTLPLSKVSVYIGWAEATVLPGASKVLYIDDFAINDGTGSVNNSWPGEGAVVMLLPTADSAVGTGWTLGTGTAPGGNGYAAVDNLPPVGVADLAAGSDPKQIRNAASAANSNYDFTVQSYTAAGVPSGATINALFACVYTAAPVSTSAKLGTIGIVSNPTVANVALSTTGTVGAFWQGNAAAAFPTGWKTSRGTTSEAPSVTLGTAPVVRVTQSTASTRIAMVCFVGVYVDYTPSAGTAWTQPVADTLSLADSATTQAGKSATLADTLAVADALASQAVFARTVTDPLSLADSQAFQRNVTLPLADTLTLADLAAAQRGIAQAVADTLSLADLAATAAGKGVSLADTLALADAVTSQAAFVRGLADTLSLADTIAAQSAFQLSIVDTLALADTLATQAAFVRALADTLTLADLASPVESEGGVDHTQPLADAVALADALTAGSTLVRAVADTLALADILTAQREILRDLADTATLADAFRFSRALGLTDTVAPTDAVSFQAAYLRTLADTVSVTDSATASRVLTQAVADLLGLADSFTFTAGRGLLLEDTLALADLLTLIQTTPIGGPPLADGHFNFAGRGRITQSATGEYTGRGHRGRLTTSSSRSLAQTTKGTT